jgi:hypothetical protein
MLLSAAADGTVALMADPEVTCPTLQQSREQNPEF